MEKDEIIKRLSSMVGSFRRKLDWAKETEEIFLGVDVWIQYVDVDIMTEALMILKALKEDPREHAAKKQKQPDIMEIINQQAYSTLRTYFTPSLADTISEKIKNNIARTLKNAKHTEEE